MMILYPRPYPPAYRHKKGRSVTAPPNHSLIGSHEVTDLCA
jgi:hypothetical protein